MSPVNERYTVGELAEVGGVSRRTLRYYVQEGLLPAPLGKGRGSYYTGDHLERLLRLKSMQEKGMSLKEIHRAQDLAPSYTGEPIMASLVRVPRSLWTRIELGPGVELQVAAGRKLPSSARLSELVEWCRKYVPGSGEFEE